jgi:heme-degrading monooxygenase HmoA
MNQPILPTEVRIAEPVTMINAFTVPAAVSEQFLNFWHQRARILAGTPGFIRSRMYRCIVDDAELGFINVAEWDSGDALAHARTNEQWRTLVRAAFDDPDVHITARPAVYQLAIDIRPGEAA